MSARERVASEWREVTSGSLLSKTDDFQDRCSLLYPMSYRRNLDEPDSNRLPRSNCATAQARITERGRRTRNRDISRSPSRAEPCRIDVHFVGVEPTVSRAGIEPAKLRHVSQPLHQKHDFGSAQNDESRLGDPAAFAKIPKKPPNSA